MIRLVDGYYINAEAVGYSLCKGAPRIEKKRGKEHVHNNIVGFYGTVEQAIKGCCMEMVHDYVSENDFELDEAVTAIRAICKRIEDLLSDIEKL